MAPVAISWIQNSVPRLLSLDEGAIRFNRPLNWMKARALKRDAMTGHWFHGSLVKLESQPARRKLESVAVSAAMSLSVILQKIFEYPLPGLESEWMTSLVTYSPSPNY